MSFVQKNAMCIIIWGGAKVTYQSCMAPKVTYQSRKLRMRVYAAVTDVFTYVKVHLLFILFEYNRHLQNVGILFLVMQNW